MRQKVPVVKQLRERICRTKSRGHLNAGKRLRRSGGFFYPFVPFDVKNVHKNAATITSRASEREREKEKRANERDRYNRRNNTLSTSGCLNPNRGSPTNGANCEIDFTCNFAVVGLRDLHRKWWKRIMRVFAGILRGAASGYDRYIGRALGGHTATPCV